MAENTLRTTLDLTQREFSNIDEYRKKKNTAVLTIMFTDIQGFTALTENKGETYVHELHREHDRILVDTIEEGGAGVVIKFIGDSIMAVFAEPTAAAEKALLIQKRLSAFNAAHPELDAILVRIGLHMGQTVIENKIQTDLFGRHVNKASRVESLASGGHVYVTYSVFDSIKSWLMDAEGAKSKLHGSYFLKGIEKAEEIYEIWNDGITVPEAPKGAKRKGAIPPALIAGIAVGGIALAFGLAFLVARGLPGIAGATGKASSGAAAPNGTSADATAPASNADDASQPSQKNESPAKAADADKTNTSNAGKGTTTAKASAEKSTDVYFLGMIAREPILDLNTPLAVTVENEAQGLKKSINDIAPGKHVIHYIVSYMVRYYAEFTVKPGKNVVQINFKESYLPGVDINYSISSGGATPDNLTDEESYFLYDHKTLNRIDYKGKVSASVKGALNADGKAEFAVKYAVTLNGKTVADSAFTVVSDPNATEWTTVPEKVIYTEGDHYYFIRYDYVGETIQVNVGASFKD
jgi:class 3 adenylate cyclase